MKKHKILWSGDYWHDDFKTLLSSINVPMTMTPIEKLTLFKDKDEQFDLVVLAQSRRNQFDSSVVEFLRDRFPGVPVVFVLGSWCEGETRSGEPIPGVIRVYWHQWMGQYAKFCQQLETSGISDWHLPTTSTVADRIEQAQPQRQPVHQSIIGVSAWTQSQFEMVADALKTLGYRTRWLERSVWDAQAFTLLSAICIDANSVTDDLVNRLSWLRTTYPGRPMVLILNFPRAQEVSKASDLGVAEILSKPFELANLGAAIKRIIESSSREQRHLIR